MSYNRFNKHNISESNDNDFACSIVSPMKSDSVIPIKYNTFTKSNKTNKCYTSIKSENNVSSEKCTSATSVKSEKYTSMNSNQSIPFTPDRYTSMNSDQSISNKCNTDNVSECNSINNVTPDRYSNTDSVSEYNDEYNSSTNNYNIIYETVEDSTNCNNYRNEYCNSFDKKIRNGNSYSNECCFNAMITPVNDLRSCYTDLHGCVEFRMRRKNKTVTLQWEPFTGAIIQNGCSYLKVEQSICNTPPYEISMPISIKYRDINKTTMIKIDPYERNGSIRFYLNMDNSGVNICANDLFYIYGGAISWIVD